MTIKEIVNCSGLTQVAFAHKYGIPLRTLQDWVTDRRKPAKYINDLLEREVKREKTMNTNIFGRNGYHALVKTEGFGKEVVSWGFDVKEEHGDSLSAELGEYLLNEANRIYKEKCPEGYYQEAYCTDKDFVEIEVDFTNYKPTESFCGDTIYVPIGEKKISIYNKKTGEVYTPEEEII